MRAEQPTEAQTRKKIIDMLLEKAEWHVKDCSQVIEEFEIAGTGSGQYKITRKKNDGASSGFSDYLLLDRAGDPLAIVEAKRTSKDPIAGKQQAEDYADGIIKAFGKKPLIFLTNGYEIWFWNRERMAPVMVHGFFTREDMERIRFQNGHRQELNKTPIKDSIVNRDYQIEAIKRISAELRKNRRKFLLVMATGTGKTRTAMALIDILIRAGWAQRVLFLVDREALAVQAFKDGFKQHLPEESRLYIRAGKVDSSCRLYTATIQTMMECFNTISPAFFDLIIADECHRSIYNKWRDVLSYFHAVQIGLTATPAEFVERDTFRFFECEGNRPVFSYPYEQAIKDKCLVDFRPAYAAQTRFQIKGIKGKDLPENLRQQLTEQGLSPDEMNFEGTDLEKKVTNAGTNESLIREFMDVCIKDGSGVVPGKSIIFAVSHDHAKRLWEIINRLYPEYKGRLAEIIDSKMERPLKLIENFKNESWPRIAISVDMLDTGIDVHEIVNLVFAKPVFSKIKFWQMIGRGTRKLNTDIAVRKPWCVQKERFLIIDHWGNFEYFGEKPDGDPPPAVTPLPIKIFKLRLAKAAYFLDGKDLARWESVKCELIADIKALPENSITIKENRKHIDKALSSAVWEDFDDQSRAFLDKQIAPLLKFKSDCSISEESFINEAEKLGFALLKGQREEMERCKKEIARDCRKLPMNLQAIKRQETLIRSVIDGVYWDSLDYDACERLKNDLAPLMRHKLSEEREILELDLDDLVAERAWIEFGPNGEGEYVKTYREKVEKKILELAEKHPALKKIKAGAPISDKDLADIEDTLNGPELFVTEENLRKAFTQPYGTFIQFIKSILGLYKFPDPEALVNESFQTYVVERNNTHPLSADQIRFLRTIKNVFAKKKHIEYADLFDPPFTQFGEEAALKLFSEDELKEIISLFNNITV